MSEMIMYDDYVSEAGYSDGMSSSDELIPTLVPFLDPEQSWGELSLEKS